MEPLTPLYYGSYSAPLTFELLAALVALWALAAVRDRVVGLATTLRERLSGPGKSAIEELEAEYAAGDLSLAEFEQRAELALDDRAAVVVERLEAVDGVGPERAIALADEFGNVEAVRRADVDDLADVHGVGPATAEKIKAAF